MTGTPYLQADAGAGGRMQAGPWVCNEACHDSELCLAVSCRLRRVAEAPVSADPLHPGGASDSGERPYVEQLARGHRQLRFAGPMEVEFREYFRRYSISHIRVALVASVLLCLLTVPLEVFVFESPAHVLRWYVLLVPGVLLVSLLAILWFSLHDQTGRMLRALVVMELLLTAGLLAGLRVIYDRAGVPFPYDVQNFLCIIIFLLSGQRFSSACLLALATAATFMATDAALGTSYVLIMTGAFNFLATAVFAGAGGFIAEYITRSNFLHRHISEHRANHDPLTGLLNRRGLDAYLPRLWRQACRERRPIALMIADIDHFKSYNDTYGHLQGDQALRGVASLLRRETVRRPMDFAARLGGEEFACVWYDMSAPMAQRLAESFRAAVEERGSEHRNAPEGRLTVSCGCAIRVPDAPSNYETLFEEADKALYEAKNAGRNRIAIHTARRAGESDPAYAA
jgi:diguanylate cyclase (GGDEF)-like protein